MTDLTRPYGAPNHGSADPVLTWINHYWGMPVRVNVIEIRDEHWLRGTLINVGIAIECLFTRQTLVELTIRADDGQELCTWIDTTAGGQLIFDSPLRRALRIIGNNGRTHVIYDDRPIRRIDTVERQLATALAEEDPVKRHAALDQLARTAALAGELEDDDGLRSRLLALNVFLEEYSGQRRGE